MSACVSSLAFFVLGPGGGLRCRFCRSHRAMPLGVPVERRRNLVFPPAKVKGNALDEGPFETNIFKVLKPRAATRELPP